MTRTTHAGLDGPFILLETPDRSLEVAYDWRKSSHSGSEGGACVEIAAHPAAVHVRDSKNPDGPTLTLTPTTRSAFAARIGS